LEEEDGVGKIMMEFGGWMVDFELRSTEYRWKTWME
jgi:hypothetical protein